MIGVRLEPELKHLLQKVAKEERRSLSNFIVHAALTYLKEHKGIDWHEKANKNSSTSPVESL